MMNIKKAKIKIFYYLLIGLLLSILSCISTVISIIKMLLVYASKGVFLSQQIKTLVSSIYYSTSPYLDWFWNYSPTPNLEHLKVYDNYIAVTIYLCIFIGFSFISSAFYLIKRIGRIKRKLEDQEIEDSLKGIKTPKPKLEEINIKDKSFFQQVHTLYIAPIVVGIILYFFGYFFSI